MIVYESNQHFLGDILHLAKSWTMVKIMRMVLAMGFYAGAITALMMLLLPDHELMDASIFSFLGIVLSILLVFRTNNSYDRWWEGRKQWGALVNTCRNLAVTVHTTFPKEDMHSRHMMAKLIANFCLAFKEHLRKGVDLGELILLTDADRAEYATKSHIPNHISLQIHQLIHRVYKGGGITGEDYLNLKPHTQDLLDILGACERIRKTPIPFSYAVFIKVFIAAYALLLPFALVATFGLWTPPIMMLIFFAFIGIEMMAEEIENPFSLDCNNLPTGTLANTIKSNVFEILQAEKGQEAPTELYQKIF
jgi:ion channel-forming bestrophin family protein